MLSSGKSGSTGSGGQGLMAALAAAAASAAASTSSASASSNQADSRRQSAADEPRSSEAQRVTKSKTNAPATQRGSGFYIS